MHLSFHLLLTQCFLKLLDVITIEKTGEYFRLMYDVKGRFTVHRITAEEAKVNLIVFKSVRLVVTFTVQAW